MSKHDDPVLADRTWLKSAVGEIFCAECHSIGRRDRRSAIDVVLEELPQTRTSGIVAEIGVTVTRADFLAQFRASLDDFAFGRCLWKSGELIATHVTAYGPRYLVLRGGKQDHYYECKSCGTLNCYYSRPNKYLLPCDLYGGAVYQTTCGTWLFNEETVARIDWSRWSDMELIDIPILDEPREGDACPLPA
jgi:hypothetical protein